jgi:FtsH-binding integral membrane protein
MERYVTKEEIESPIVLRYVSDVYKFLTIFLLFYALGVYLPMVDPSMFRVGPGWVIGGFIVSTILTAIGIYSFVFGSIAALCFGMIGSRYLQYMLTLYPSLVIVAGCGTSLIFLTATLCAKYLTSRRIVTYVGLTISMLQLILIFLLFRARYDVVLSLIIMTLYVYYDMLNVFERAKMHLHETSRNRFIVLDAFNLFLDIIGIFMDILRIINRSRRDKSSMNR